MSKRNGTMPDYVSCPFCQETDFDLIGLKHHFQAGHCDVWNEIPPPPSLRPHGLPEGARVIATCDLSTTAQETSSALVCRHGVDTGKTRCLQCYPLQGDKFDPVAEDVQAAMDRDRE